MLLHNLIQDLQRLERQYGNVRIMSDEIAAREIDLEFDPAGFTDSDGLVFGKVEDDEVNGLIMRWF